MPATKLPDERVKSFSVASAQHATDVVAAAMGGAEPLLWQLHT